MIFRDFSFIAKVSVKLLRPKILKGIQQSLTVSGDIFWIFLWVENWDKFSCSSYISTEELVSWLEIKNPEESKMQMFGVKIKD